MPLLFPLILLFIMLQPRLTYEQMKSLEAALATVDPHAATALKSRFSQEPRLLQALLATEGQVNTALLR